MNDQLADYANYYAELKLASKFMLPSKTLWSLIQSIDPDNFITGVLRDKSLMINFNYNYFRQQVIDDFKSVVKPMTELFFDELINDYSLRLKQAHNLVKGRISKLSDFKKPNFATKRLISDLFDYTNHVFNKLNVNQSELLSIIEQEKEEFYVDKKLLATYFMNSNLEQLFESKRFNQTRIYNPFELIENNLNTINYHKITIKKDYSWVKPLLKVGGLVLTVGTLLLNKLVTFVHSLPIFYDVKGVDVDGDGDFDKYQVFKKTLFEHPTNPFFTVTVVDNGELLETINNHDIYLNFIHDNGTPNDSSDDIKIGLAPISCLLTPEGEYYVDDGRQILYFTTIYHTITYNGEPLPLTHEGFIVPLNGEHDYLLVNPYRPYPIVYTDETGFQIASEDQLNPHQAGSQELITDACRFFTYDINNEPNFNSFFGDSVDSLIDDKIRDSLYSSHETELSRPELNDNKIAEMISLAAYLTKKKF
ncbi:MAG TPA: hypothetical protein VI790_03675 [Candidatus Nanoarchaeia archaeon]|nr:hypothetical protein [Candidatus Nanoarchaeia archaeon]